MVPLPPRIRELVVCQSGLKSGCIPSPEGFSLITSHIYTRVTGFYENVNNDPHFMNPYILKEAFKKTLEFYYPLTGRLIPRANGRYDIGNFDKGAVFEVVDSTDDFQEWKKSNFSFSVVPYEDLFPIKSYVGRDSPLFGVRLTYLRCGSVAVNYNIHHKIADGVLYTNFMKDFARVCRGEELDPNAIYWYPDSKRTPVQPLLGVDHNDMYPKFKSPEDKPPIDIKIAPSKKIILAFDRKKVAQMKLEAVEASGGQKLSQFDVLTASIHKSIIKARQREPEYCSDLICVVGNHHRHPDKNMRRYLGNYIVPVPVSFKTKDVMGKQLHEIAKDIGDAKRRIDIPFMESLEYYLNSAENIEAVESPAARLGRGAVGVSDWSRFVGEWDCGWGLHKGLRSFVETSPIPLVTVMPFTDDTIEVIVQLDVETFDRFLKDQDIMKYVQNIY